MEIHLHPFVRVLDFVFSYRDNFAKKFVVLLCVLKDMPIDENGKSGTESVSTRRDHPDTYPNICMLTVPIVCLPVSLLSNGGRIFTATL